MLSIRFSKHSIHPKYIFILKQMNSDTPRIQMILPEAKASLYIEVFFFGVQQVRPYESYDIIFHRRYMSMSMSRQWFKIKKQKKQKYIHLKNMPSTYIMRRHFFPSQIIMAKSLHNHSCPSKQRRLFFVALSWGLSKITERISCFG